MKKQEKVEYLGKTISEFMKVNNNLDFGEIYTQVFESLLEAERDQYLKYEKGDRTLKNMQGIKDKRNGFYLKSFDQFVEKMALRIPRVRLGEFQPLILEKLESKESKINKLAFYLYVKGLSTRDINDVLQEMYGIAVSPQWVSDITTAYEEKRKEWQGRELEPRYYAVMIDALHLNIRRDSVDNEAMYIVLGLRTDLRREVLGLYLIPEESATGWSEVIKDLKKRGMKQTLLFVSDGLKGLQEAVTKVYPRSHYQGCVVHKERNILSSVRQKEKKEIGEGLRQIFDIQNPNHTKQEANKKIDQFLERWEKLYPNLSKQFDDREKMFTYLDFPYALRSMIYTTNWIERLNRSIRKVIKNKGSFPNPDSALNLVYMVIEDVQYRVYSYQITSLISIQDQLNEMFLNLSHIPLDT